MTSSTLTALPQRRAPFQGHLSQWRITVSEFTKLRSLRSTAYALLAAVVLTIGLSAIAASVTGSRWTSMSLHDRATFDALSVSTIGVTFALLAIGVLGVLTITNEYTSGTIRSTLAAVPKRLPVLWAKAAVFSGVTLLVMLPISVVGFLIGQAILHGHTFNGHDISLSLSDPGVARAVIGSALSVTLAGLLAMGLGAILRSTAGGISAFVALLFVITPLVNILPSSWQNAISPYLPANAGTAMMEVGHHAHTLGPWTGFGVLAAYTAVVFAFAAVQLRRRDA